MNRFLLVFFVILLTSCQNREAVIGSMQLAQATEDPVYTNDEVISTDTIFFVYQDDKKYDDYALAHLLKKTCSRDSICSLEFKIDFLQKNQLVYTDRINVKSVSEGSEWNGSYELDSISSPFKRISFGYPACGYDQSNFLFYIDGKNSSKVHTWSSVGDGGWYTDVQFFLISNTKLAATTQSFWPDETTTEEDQPGEEYGLFEYSDSIHFTRKNNKWNKEIKTSKGKVYRKKRISYSEYYKIDE